ncbi:MAG TPA: sulfite exporter TauE/SafE family protein [Thiotrichaceae bacterium]|nr:sulfite exporter TauE/SafE family protein [Thiotrichaceae bacterium]
MEYLSSLMLFAIGTVAGMLNVMAGGGSALTLPALIFLGLDSTLANGTNRVAILVQNIFAILSFRQQKLHEFESSFKLALWTLPGGIIGAIVAIKIDEQWFERILAIVLIGVVLSMIFAPEKRIIPLLEEGKTRKWLVYPAMLGIGFYGGFIQVGVGFLLMAALFHLVRCHLVVVNMHKVFIVFIYTIPALGIFIWSGHVDWVLGLSLAAGNAFGGWWAAQLSVKKGEKMIRFVLLLAILIIALKLLNIF